MAERYEYFVDLVLLGPLDLLSLGSNAADLGGKGFRLVASAPVSDPERRACLLLFWERGTQRCAIVHPRSGEATSD